MNYRDIKVPPLNNDFIKNRADLFRKSFWDKSIPVDIERIIDLKLKLNIVPVPDLQRICDVDALIASNWEEIYVDNDRYLDDRYQNRLRFSFAHEIGHFILHKDIYESFSLSSFEDFYDLMRDIPQEQYSYLETQANKFANYLLVPRVALAQFKSILIRNKIMTLKVDKRTLDSYLAIPISEKFGVSEKVIEIALNELDDN